MAIETTRIFGKEAVISLTGLTYRQIDYWATTGVVIPYKPGAGKGSRREYSFTDIVALRVAKKLREDGISLQKIKKALSWLRKQEEFKDLRQILGELKFITDGEALFVVDRDLVRDRERIIDALKSGQYVFSVTLGRIVEDLKGEVKKLAKPRETKVWVSNRPYTVVLIPDTEDGGVSAKCKEVPMVISKGKTEQNALDNIIDALELLKEKKENAKVV